MVAWAENLEDLTGDTIKSRLSTMKANIVGTFESEVANLSTDHAALKHIRKAKKWLKVRTLGKVLGPLFDVATVGVNAWALQTAIRDCVSTPSQCNHDSLAAASLSIVSGLVGLATFAAVLKASAAAAAFISPIGAIIAAALGITATLIELFYTPPPDPEAIQNSLKEATMRGLDVYSRIQITPTDFLQRTMYKEATCTLSTKAISQNGSFTVLGWQSSLVRIRIIDHVKRY